MSEVLTSLSNALAGLAESGAYRPVIDQVFAFGDIAAAHARVESHRKRGNVVVAFDPL